MSAPIFNIIGQRTAHAMRRPSAARLLALATRLVLAGTVTGLVYPARALDSAGTLTAAPPTQQPEADTGTTAKDLVTARRHMVVAADPRASAAGLEMLRAGGSAVDAAIAAQLVLALVEPQSSGLGGGAFLVHWDQASAALATYDGRETAPMAARSDRFLIDGQLMPRPLAVRSGLSVGVPGAVRLLHDAHVRHGRLPWAQLFAPAIRLARDGFTVSARLAGLLARDDPQHFSPAARSYFFTTLGQPRRAGDVLVNPDFAATLEAIAANGPDAFYKGAVAEAMVKAVSEAPIPGDLTLADLAAYRVEPRAPLCFSYRARRICGMGPPSGGTTTVGATLSMLEPIALGPSAPASLNTRALHWLIEAQRLAYADRDRYIADPAFQPVPAGLLDPDYLAARRSLIDPLRAMAGKPEAGSPPGLSRRASFGADATQENTGTSHISVLDGYGNAVSMTTTIEQAFGSRLWASGFLLNNELTDFSLAPSDADGAPIANRIEPGKRPRSSMTPLVVFDRFGRLHMVVGSPGGNQIPYYVVKTLVALIDWRLDAQRAAALPNFGSRGSEAEIEPTPQTMFPALRLVQLGHRVRFTPLTSGTHVIVIAKGRITGGADPRREGAALGD